MQQSYTEVTTTSWGSRIKNALVGLILWPILVVLAVYLLWTNEGRSVKIETGLQEGKSQVVAVKSDSVDPASESKLVYVTGKVAMTKNPSDDLFGITQPAIRIVRKVEMYQWKEHSKSSKSDNLWGSQTTRTTYTYDTVWSDNSIDSSKFRNQTADKTNPTDWKYQSATYEAEGVTVGAYSVLPEILGKLEGRDTVSLAGKTIPGTSVYGAVPSATTPVMPRSAVSTGALTDAPGSVSDRAVTSEEVAVPDATAPAPDATAPAPEVATPVPEATAPVPVTTPTAIPPSAIPQVRSLYVVGDTLSYSRNPNAPEVGDLKITFYTVDPTDLSVIGKQNNGTLGKYVTKNGTEIGLISEGIVSSDAMFQTAIDNNVFMTWVWRILGVVLMFMGFSLFLSIFSVLAAFLPFLGSVVGFGTGLISLVLTLVLWGSTIAIAWISARPIVAVIILVVVAAGIFGIVSYKKKRGAGVYPPA